MAANENSKHTDTKQQQKGTSEDPPNDLVKQNEQDKHNSKEINVPKEAVENYKQSGKEGEE